MKGSTSSPGIALNTAADPVSEAWPPFAMKLAAVLAQMREDQYLIVADKRSSRFVQFAGQGALGMRAETVCNVYLPPAEQLGQKQLQMLAALGWRGPTGTPDEATPERDPDGSPNHFLEFAQPVPFDVLARLAVRTLSEVLCVPHPGFLQYSAFDGDGNSVSWPDLGLKREEPKETVAADVAPHLLAAVEEASGLSNLAFDDDGDICLRYGTLPVCVRLDGEPLHVRFHSLLINGAEVTPRLLERLNEFNGTVGGPRFLLRNDRIWAVTDVPAVPLVADHVACALRSFCRLADTVSDRLLAEFSGASNRLLH